MSLNFLSDLLSQMFRAGTSARAHGPQHMGPSTSARAHGPQHMCPSTWAPAHGPRHMGPSTSAPAHRPQHMGPSTWAPAHGPQHVRPRLRPSRVGRRRPKDYSIRGRRQYSSVIVSIRQYFDSSATIPKVYGWNFTCKNNGLRSKSYYFTYANPSIYLGYCCTTVKILKNTDDY